MVGDNVIVVIGGYSGAKELPTHLVETGQVGPLFINANKSANHNVIYIFC